MLHGYYDEMYAYQAKKRAEEVAMYRSTLVAMFGLHLWDAHVMSDALAAASSINRGGERTRGESERELAS